MYVFNVRETGVVPVHAIVVMGVSGAGKTTVGQALAESLGWSFRDADEFHSHANIEKMSHGVALTDADRAPWLQALCFFLADTIEHDERVVLACSALKESYREALAPRDAPSGAIRFVFLDVPADVLRQRLLRRHHHYFGAELLNSQLATLEKPADALVVNGTLSPEQLVHTIREELDP